LVSLLLEGPTTKIRNQIAGYITRYLASEEIEEETEEIEETQEEGESS
jgi:ribosomal protein S17E